jgi:hypothetical protein
VATDPFVFTHDTANVFAPLHEHDIPVGATRAVVPKVAGPFVVDAV